MDKKAENGEKDKFIKKMKGLNAYDEFIEALLVKCNKDDVMKRWTDVSEPDKDKLIKALEADEDFSEIFNEPMY